MENKDKKNWKIEFASRNKLDQLAEWVEIVLEAVGHPEAFVSDGSSIWDFHPLKEGQEEWLKEVSDKLGFPVSTKDYIWEVAEQVRANQWKKGGWNEDEAKTEER
jgi:hypothetical protein